MLVLGSPPVFWTLKTGREIQRRRGQYLMMAMNSKTDDQSTWRQVMMMVVKDVLFHDESKDCHQ